MYRYSTTQWLMIHFSLPHAVAVYFRASNCSKLQLSVIMWLFACFCGYVVACYPCTFCAKNVVLVSLTKPDGCVYSTLKKWKYFSPGFNSSETKEMLEVFILKNTSESDFQVVPNCKSFFFYVAPKRTDGNNFNMRFNSICTK
jgi:hypothetical protein